MTTPLRFLNHYRCQCGCAWSDSWSSTCDDRCPECNRSISPYFSDDLPDEIVETAEERELRLLEAIRDMQPVSTASEVCLSMALAQVKESAGYLLKLKAKLKQQQHDSSLPHDGPRQAASVQECATTGPNSPA